MSRLGRGPRGLGLLVVAIGLTIGVVALAATPAVAAVAPPAAASFQIGVDGIVISTSYPAMTACEAIPFTNCFHFSDGTVVGQIAPFQFLDQFLGLFGIGAGGCTTISNLGSGSPYVDAIYVGSAVPLVVGAGSCTDLAGDVAAHAETLVVPFSTETIAPAIVSVEDLSLAIAPSRPLRPAGS
jgi:hypothetical protein